MHGQGQRRRPTWLWASRSRNGDCWRRRLEVRYFVAPMAGRTTITDVALRRPTLDRSRMARLTPGLRNRNRRGSQPDRGAAARVFIASAGPLAWRLRRFPPRCVLTLVQAIDIDRAGFQLRKESFFRV